MTETRLERWEARLKQVFDEINDELEASHGHRARRHPNRPPHGATSNREDDGLFDLGAAFTVGIGSQFEADVARRLQEKLPAAFPGVVLHVDRDGPVYKIHGDLSLGTL